MPIPTCRRSSTPGRDWPHCVNRQAAHVTTGSVARLTCLLLALALAQQACGRSGLPSALGDREFWHLVETLSEPAGQFTLSENLVSNEPRVAENLRWLRPAGGVYVGVGPEQNFSYIARLRPSLAFIVDIRTENRNLHLLYKVLFEVSGDRADMVSRLFSRPRPSDLGSSASASELFARYDRVVPSPDQYRATTALVRERAAAHGWALAAADLEWIDRTLTTFQALGPDMHFYGTRRVDLDVAHPSYRQLMTATDAYGQVRSFLDSEESFHVVRALHAKNLIVPVVGNFAGPSTLRSIGDYVRVRGSVIQAFYGSNVSAYLTNEQAAVYCRTLATLPMARSAWFVDSDGVRPFSSKLNACAR